MPAKCELPVLAPLAIAVIIGISYLAVVSATNSLKVEFAVVLRLACQQSALGLFAFLAESRGLRLLR
jgi:hypothetical protein